jgi:predicted nuclease with TOPRIM domain
MPSEIETTETTGDEEEVVVQKTTPATTTAPAQPDEDYESRFKGLQRSYNKLQKKHSELTASLEQTSEQREEALMSQSELEKQLKKLQEDMDSLDKEKANLAGQLASQEVNVKRSTLIMSEFSDLARFEAQGLLPPAEDEEKMRELFALFRDTLGSSVDSAVDKKMVGVTAKASGNVGTPMRTKEQVYRELTNLSGARSDEDRKAYRQLIEEWDVLNKE